MSVIGKKECLRDEAIVLREGHLQSPYILCKIILSRKSVHPREMVDFLMALHFTQHLHANRSISPSQIPLTISSSNIEPHLPANLLNNCILTISEIDEYGFGLPPGGRALGADYW